MEEFLPWPEYRWDEIQEVLDEFHSLLSERVPRLRIERQEDVLDWEQQTGVYLLFGPNEELLYVGFTPGLTHHNSEAGLAGKPCLLVKSKLLDHIFATFR